MNRRTFDSTAPLQFVVNGKSGNSDSDATCAEIEAVLRDAGRACHVHFAAPGELAAVAKAAARTATETDSAVVAVGGDGTISTVAQAAYDAGCVMGVIPEGTFNYFAREHGVPTTSVSDALQWLLRALPEPVQISAVNEQVFLVNASLGLYPDLLQDRESWKARFGRSQLVAFSAGISTLLRAQRRLRLSIEWEQQRRELVTLTLFVGNNRLQLEQLGLNAGDIPSEGASSDGHITAVILRPLGTLAMLNLMLRGAMGQLGEAASVDHFVCRSLHVKSSSLWGEKRVKVACDGEVTWMDAPLTLRVLPEPLWLLKAVPLTESPEPATAA